jgi:hypothetical protein
MATGAVTLTRHSSLVFVKAGHLCDRSLQEGWSTQLICRPPIYQAPLSALAPRVKLAVFEPTVKNSKR